MVSILKAKKILLSIIFAILIFSNTPSVLASTTDGTVPADSYAWGENLSWINFGLSTGNIHVTNTAITGYAWSQNYGWINFSPTNGGVTNNTSGTLGGNAWAAGLGGWIPFDGVTINSSGKFTGIAGITGSDAGRINFDCTNCNITTDWRPSTTPTSTPSTSTTTTTTTTTTAASATSLPTIVPTFIPASVPVTTSIGETFTAPSSVGQLFDVVAQPVLQAVSKNNLVVVGFLLLIFLLILIYIIYRINREIKRQKLENIKKIKKIK